jgi:hypothetical protein
MEVGGQRHAPTALLPVPIVQDAGWAPGPIWNGVENLVPTVIRVASRPIPTDLSSSAPQLLTDSHET